MELAAQIADLITAVGVIVLTVEAWDTRKMRRQIES